MASRARVEQQPAATGTTLIVMVGLGIAFLLFMAFLNVVKSGNLLNESNLLYAALIFYAGAGALYLGFGVTGTESYVRFASLATWAGLAANTGAVAHRWYEAGHPPFASIYEMLLSFVWTLAVLTLIAEKKFGVKVIGTVTMPVAIVGGVLMQLLRTDVRPLVPALQSTWLHVHVTLAMLAYAACALGFALALMFLIQDGMRSETFLATTSLFTMGVYMGILTRFDHWGGLSVIAWNAQEKSEIFLQRGVRMLVVIPDLGWLMLLVLLVVAAPFVLYVAARVRNNEGLFTVAHRAVFISILLQILALLVFLLRARNGQYPSLDAEGLYATSLAASAFILSGLVGGIFSSLLYLLLLWRRPDLERLLPSADALDRITYKTICIAFPLLTLMIAAGAYWANRTWGSYWS
jgi:ABC-type transport system involved in cytochrome c biogenesis permease subunit